MLRSKLWHREILQLPDAGELTPNPNLPLPMAIRAEFEAIVSMFDTHNTEIVKLRTEVTELKDELRATRQQMSDQHDRLVSLLLQGRSGVSNV